VRFTVVLAILGVAGAARVARADDLRGTVFADANGNGLFDAGERGVATVVAWEDEVLAETDPDGAFVLPARAEGLVWARVPDGYAPGAVWAKGQPGDDAVDLALTPLAPGVAGTPVTFVVAADSHLHADAHNYGMPLFLAAIGQATRLDPPPRFFTILGDLTQANEPAELEQVALGAAALDVPWVPVSGNHDWYDGGAAWRAALGPEIYSFDIADVHFVVVSTNVLDDELRVFVARELALVRGDPTIVVMGHEPLELPTMTELRELGVDVYLAGHWHANRAVHFDGLLELDTEPFLMGGMDGLPAGYRVVTITGGDVTVDHHTVVRAPWLRLAAPLAGRCLRVGESVIVAAAIDARPLEVTVRIGEQALALTHDGGWAYQAPLPALRVGDYPVRIEARAGDDLVADVSGGELRVCDDAPARFAVGAWPQPGGGPAHTGRQDARIAARVVERWATPVGGHVAGAPVIADGRVIVATTDLARGDTGGVVALDARTGAILWRVTTPAPVRAAPIVAGALVVLTQADGRVVALDAATGGPRWTYDAAAGLDPKSSSLWSSPVADAGVIYAGVQRRFAALDAATGAPRWTVDPVPNATWHGTLSSPAIAGDVVLAQLERNKQGVQAWTRDGRPAWRVPPDYTYSMNATPAVDGDRVYLANGIGDALMISAIDGAVIWARLLTDDRHTWAYAITASPAVARGVVVFATEHDELWALDADTGDGLWTWAPGPSPVLAAHYRGPGAGFAASPVITGDVVWAAATDGTVAALDLHTGEVLQRLQVGAPVFAGLAAAGELLVVAGWDGTVHGLSHQDPTPRPPRTPLVELAAALVIAGRALARLRRGL